MIMLVGDYCVEDIDTMCQDSGTFEGLLLAGGQAYWGKNFWSIPIFTDHGIKKTLNMYGSRFPALTFSSRRVKR